MVYNKNTMPDHSHMLRHPVDEISLEERQKRLDRQDHVSILLCESFLRKWSLFQSM